MVLLEATLRPIDPSEISTNNFNLRSIFNIGNCQSTANIYLFCVFRNVLIDTITKLLPDKEYLIQVTVKKTKGKVLSYDLLRVRTNVQC